MSPKAQERMRELLPETDESGRAMLEILDDEWNPLVRAGRCGVICGYEEMECDCQSVCRKGRSAASAR